MFAFLFDNYGYYPVNIVNESFVYKNWFFKLERVDDNEEKIKSIASFSVEIAKKLDGKSGYIIKNKNGKYISHYNGIAYVLISIPNVVIDLVDYYKLHEFFSGIDNREYSLKKVLSLQEEKYEFISNVVVSSIRKDHSNYKEFLQLIFYSFGLAENSFQYLADIIEDSNDKLERLTISHKKKCSFDTYSFLNPLNMIIDNPVRDLAFLFKSEEFSISEIENILDYYQINAKEASYLMSRILYPDFLFEELIEFYDNKKDIFNFLFEQKQKISFNYTKLNTIYKLLQTKYSIRPIKWLEKTIL
ncbi:MAG: hypothetical protein E7184_02730 [Erysipelotrichaceae bacterium]|nr:hypothetical protein [Erysipelotrichaceae bacterium]